MEYEGRETAVDWLVEVISNITDYNRMARICDGIRNYEPAALSEFAGLVVFTFDQIEEKSSSAEFDFLLGDSMKSLDEMIDKMKSGMTDEQAHDYAERKAAFESQNTFNGMMTSLSKEKFGGDDDGNCVFY